MGTSTIIFRFILFAMLQVLVLNNFQISGAINPKIYLLFIFTLPPNMNKALKLVLAFLMGLTIDVFENSGGIHASASVLLTFILPLLYRTMTTSGGVELTKINMHSVGQQKFMTYVTLGTLIHHTWLFSLEAFSFNNYMWVIKEILLSSVATILIIYIAEMLTRKKPDRI